MKLLLYLHKIYIMTEIIIPRPYYIEQIEKNLLTGQIIALTGQRRVGKSYVLKEFRDLKTALGNNVIYIDKEKYEFDHISEYRQLNEYIISRFDKDRDNYILIDEVQDIDQFEKSLRHWRTESRTFIIVTGSNANTLSSQLTTIIGGRFKEIYIQSLSYAEFLDFHGLEDSEENLIKYIDYGGLPGLIKFGLNPDARQYQNDVLNTALIKDVIQRNGIRNVNFLYNLINFIADNIGKPFSPFSISKYMKSQGEKVSPTMIANYLSALCEAYIMSYVKRYDIHGKSILEGNGKYYFEDIGIRNAMVGGTRQADIEKIIENIVYQQLIRTGYEVNVGQLKAGEVDFVCRRPGIEMRLYIQVAYVIASEETYEREFGALRRIKDNYPKYVISMSPLIDRTDDYGIVHFNLRRFLTKGLN